jgi:hypothetical protein
MKLLPATATDSSPPVQLRLATGDVDEAVATAALSKTSLHLLAIKTALETLHGVADRRIHLDDHSIDDLRRALNTLDAAGPLPGRLGYLTRLVNAGPVADYADVVTDLAFAVHLNDKSGPTS